LAPTCDPNL